MTRDIAKLISDSALFKHLSASPDFTVAGKISFDGDSSDSDFDERMKDMRSFCADHTTGRFRFATPMSERKIHVEFEKINDALMFKMKFS